MKLVEVAEMLAGSGVPVAYYAWPESKAPPLPYICYYYPSMSPETADDTHQADIYSLNVEFYTPVKDADGESLIEAIFKNAGMVFTKEETYLNDEHMYEVLYMMEVIING